MKTNPCPKDWSQEIRLLESLVVPVPEAISRCFVCHHQECFFRHNAAFDAARVEGSAFHPDKDSLKRFGFVIVGPKWQTYNRRRPPKTAAEKAMQDWQSGLDFRLEQ
jgi:hypothetical protein